ncbi:MAG: peptidyl-prolyl cis-trans isomerase [Myxococcales bacterium]|nr:peptidyl-prolyl cis-trans isomerase [Myxococcales bacterium]MCB9532390.1 peptidyl-prolyl cis-trans isomerase [Myxococcales bacterium]
MPSPTLQAIVCALAIATAAFVPMACAPRAAAPAPAAAPADVPAGSGEPGGGARTATTPTPAPMLGAVAADGSPIVAVQGALAVSAAQVDEAIAWRTLVVGESIQDAFGPAWRDDDRLVRGLVGPLFEESLLRFDLARWGVDTTAAVAGALDGDEPQLAEVRGLAPEVARAWFADRGLDIERARWLAASHTLRDLWLDHRLTLIGEEDRYRAWLAARDTATVDYVILANIFEPAVIDRLLAEEPGAIEQHFRDNWNLFLMPRTARVRQVGVVVGGDPPEVARARIDALRARAASDGIMSVLRSSELNVAMGDDGTSVVSQQQAPIVFDTAVGELTPVVEDHGALWFAEVVELRERQVRPFDETTRRFVAQELARSRGMSAQTRAAADRIAAAMAAGDDAALAAAAAAEHGRLDHSASFRRSEAGMVPGIGLARELVDAALADGRAVGEVLGAFRVSDGVVVARLASRQRPDPAAYPQEADAFRAGYDEFVRGQAWGLRVAEYGREHRRELDLETLRAWWSHNQDGSGAETPPREPGQVRP